MTRALAAASCALLLSAQDVYGARQEGRGSMPALVTDRTEYSAALRAGHVQFTVGLRYTNRSITPKYIPACKEPDPPRLEKLVNGHWVSAYTPVVFACAGPPVVILIGATYVYQMHVSVAFGEYSYPEFKVAEIPGTYRAVWRMFQVWAAQERPEFAYPEEFVSNTFTVR